MNSKEYIKNAVRTESNNFEAIKGRLNTDNIRLLHAVIGLSTEANEALDALKKHVFYGKPLDMVNLKEEIGDTFWYCAIIADVLGFNFEEVMDRNIEKLKARYSDKFSEEKAINRDLNTERNILKG